MKRLVWSCSGCLALVPDFKQHVAFMLSSHCGKEKLITEPKMLAESAVSELLHMFGTIFLSDVLWQKVSKLENMEISFSSGCWLSSLVSADCAVTFHHYRLSAWVIFRWICYSDICYLTLMQGEIFFFYLCCNLSATPTWENRLPTQYWWNTAPCWSSASTADENANTEPLFTFTPWMHHDLCMRQTDLQRCAKCVVTCSHQGLWIIWTEEQGEKIKTDESDEGDLYLMGWNWLDVLEMISFQDTKATSHSTQPAQRLWQYQNQMTSNLYFPWTRCSCSTHTVAFCFWENPER